MVIKLGEYENKRYVPKLNISLIEKDKHYEISDACQKELKHEFESVLESLDYEEYYLVVTDFLCLCLSKLNWVELHVSGFGKEDWNASFEFDACVIAAQLDEVISALFDNVQQSFDFNFYEQGIDLFMHFVPVDGSYTIEASFINGRISDSVLTKVTMPKKELQDMFVKYAEEFFRIGEEVWPSVEKLPVYQEWKESIQKCYR